MVAYLCIDATDLRRHAGESRSLGCIFPRGLHTHSYDSDRCGGARRLRLRRRRGAAPARPPSQPAGRLGRRGHQRRPARRRPLPRPRPRLRRPHLLHRRRGPEQGRRGAVRGPAPRPRRHAHPAARRGGRAGGRPLGRLPPARPRRLPDLVRRAPPLPGGARRLAVRPSRAAPGRAARDAARGRARLLPDRRPARARAAARGRPGRAVRHRGRRQVRPVRRRALAHRRLPVRAGQRERDPVPRRPAPPHPGDRAGARPGGRAVRDGHLHPPPRADEPRPAGHLLRQPRPRRRRRGPGRRPGPRVRIRAVRRRAAGRRLAGHPRRRGQQPRPGRRGGRRRRPGGGRRGHRQPRQGCRRPGGAVRQPRPRPAGDGRPRPRPPGPVSVPVDRGLGVDAAAGFSATGVACGIKPTGELDLAVVVGPPGTVAAGAFTTNVVVAAPVVWSRSRLAASPDARAVVVNSGNANACTGPAGHRAVRATAERAAAELGCLPEQVLVCSTGVIGVPLDAGRVGDGIAKAAASLGAQLDRASPPGGPGGSRARPEPRKRAATQSRAVAPRSTEGPGGSRARPEPRWRAATQSRAVAPRSTRASDGRAAAEAIRTTDTVAKQAGTVLPGGVTVGGMAKGAAMLAPALATVHATMLAVLTTDALADPAALRSGLATAVEESFNRITVDGAQSTNDTVLLLASGASGVRPHPDELAEVVHAVCYDLAGQMLADAEGGSKVVSVHVGGAGTVAAACAVARRVADSPLVKAAVYGGDPNWGRILQAAGCAGVELDPARVRLEVRGGPGAAGIEPLPVPEPGPDGRPGWRDRPDRVVLVRDGAPTGADARAAMAAREVEVRLHLGGPGPWACIRTADLTPEYVRLNSEYT